MRRKIFVQLFMLALVLTIRVPAYAEHDVTYVVNPYGGGRIENATNVADCGDTLTLTAIAEPGYEFSGWRAIKSGTMDVSGFFSDTSDPTEVSFLMPCGNVTITANFLRFYTISVGSDGNGSVSVNGGIGTAHPGDRVTLTAIPNEGRTPAEWSGNVEVDPTDNSFIMPDYDVTLTASFPPLKYTVTVETDGNGTASATDGAYSSVSFQAAPGTAMSLCATPNSGYEFDAWEGDVPAASGTPYSFTMPQRDMRVKALFKEKESEITPVVLALPPSTGGEIVNINLGSGSHTHSMGDMEIRVVVNCECSGAGTYYVCPTCGKSFDRDMNVVDPGKMSTGHRWSHWNVVVRPTPTKPGLEKCTCYNCGQEKFFTIYYNENPKTGDESNMALWISLAAVALLGTAGAVWYMKRKKEN